MQTTNITENLIQLTRYRFVNTFLMRKGDGAGGVAMPLGRQESYERLIEMVDRGLRASGAFG